MFRGDGSVDVSARAIFATTSATSGVFAIATFVLLYGAYLALKPADLELSTGSLLINGQPVKLPVEPVLRLIALVVSALIALVTGLGMMSQWTTFALYWHQTAAGPA